jgi:glutamyl/glutaminyl-tRNA synthetase
MPLRPSPATLASIPPGAVTRFAPSPTGVLHLGHVANAVWVFGIAQAVRGRVLVRVEDHDRGRSRRDFESSILADLDWLGLGSSSAAPPVRQSDRPARYETALGRLAAAGLAYGCRCSRRDIARAAGGSPRGRFEELQYPGTCRDRGFPLGPEGGVRVRLPEGSVRFTDLADGPMVQVPADQCGDVLARDAVGNWTYQFSVTVDDLEDAVTLVIRGADLLESTGRQILLARLLGRTEPAIFLHHPLIFDTTGFKLSKRDGAAGLDQLRGEGWTRERVLGAAAFATGLTSEAGPIGPNELGRLFTG